MIDKDANQIDDTASSTTIGTRLEEASGNGLGDNPARFPSPESNSGNSKIRRNASAPKRESNRVQDKAPVKPVQFPFTRSNASQPTEKTQISAIERSDSCIRGTRAGHNGAFRNSVTLSNRSKNRPQRWVTRLGHTRSVRGLSLRGSISAAGRMP